MTTSDTNSIQEKVHTICNELYAKGTNPTENGRIFKIKVDDFTQLATNLL
ncbi:hypothetical protein Xekj_00660 [Xenorhabdus sp. KJ12.1]|nr:hypothetical protein Xekj_00660 [Xenorhabdus sp. KJ12.1]